MDGGHLCICVNSFCDFWFISGIKFLTFVIFLPSNHCSLVLFDLCSSDKQIRVVMVKRFFVEQLKAYAMCS